MHTHESPLRKGQRYIAANGKTYEATGVAWELDGETVISGRLVKEGAASNHKSNHRASTVQIAK